MRTTNEMGQPKIFQALKFKVIKVRAQEHPSVYVVTRCIDFYLQATEFKNEIIHSVIQIAHVEWVELWVKNQIK